MAVSLSLMGREEGEERCTQGQRDWSKKGKGRGKQDKCLMEEKSKRRWFVSATIPRSQGKEALLQQAELWPASKSVSCRVELEWWPRALAGGVIFLSCLDWASSNCSLAFLSTILVSPFLSLDRKHQADTTPARERDNSNERRGGR